MSEITGPAGSDAKPQKAECYKTAYRFMQDSQAAQKAGAEPGLEKARFFLVHGSVVSRAEHPACKRIDHAWIEMVLADKCFVLEFSSPKPDYREKSAWAKELNAIEERRYTAEEAWAEAHKCDKPQSGPWHREPLPPRDP